MNALVNWTFWLTGAALWAFVLWRVGDAVLRSAIFAYRMGWRNARGLGWRAWLDWTISPPDAVGEWYWPSKSGAAMRARDELQ